MCVATCGVCVEIMIVYLGTLGGKFLELLVMQVVSSMTFCSQLGDCAPSAFTYACMSTGKVVQRKIFKPTCTAKDRGTLTMGHAYAAGRADKHTLRWYLQCLKRHTSKNNK